MPGKEHGSKLIVIVIVVLMITGALAILINSNRLDADLEIKHQAVHDYLLEFNTPIVSYIFEQATTTDGFQTAGMQSPSSFKEFLDAGVISELPLNPFTGEHVRFLAVDELPSPGDFTYIPAKVEFFEFIDGEAQFDSLEERRLWVEGAYYLIGWGLSTRQPIRQFVHDGLTEAELTRFAELNACAIVQISFEPHQHDLYMNWESLTDALARAESGLLPAD